jgi:galactose mutarotase-like enzyme
MVSIEPVAGHRAVVLQSDRLRVTVLPEKGADIYALVERSSGVDALMKTPWGLRPPAATGPADFLENYEGAWQELFPSANDACDYQGCSIPFHGEVALRAWSWVIERDDDGACRVALTVTTRTLPFRLERRMTLEKGSPRLVLEERLTNLGAERLPFVWGHHLVLGAPFLEAGCRLEIPAGEVRTPDEVYEPQTAELPAKYRGAWPHAPGRAPGSRIDLRHIPGPEAHTHDDVYLSGFDRGHWMVTNPRRRLRFSLDWDADLFRSVTLWRPFGGSDLPPLTGIYGVGIEPWVSRHNLARAIEAGEARWLEPGAQLETTVTATYEPGA